MHEDMFWASVLAFFFFFCLCPFFYFSYFFVHFCFTNHLVRKIQCHIFTSFWAGGCSWGAVKQSVVDMGIVSFFFLFFLLLVVLHFADLKSLLLVPSSLHCPCLLT